MGVDLTVAVQGTVSPEARNFIDKILMLEHEGQNDWWTPFWGEETDEDGIFWTYCLPGDRYIGCDDPFVGCMNLQKLPRLLEIWSAFSSFIDMGNSNFWQRRSIYFLPDYKTPGPNIEPITYQKIRDLARMAQETTEGKI